MGLRMFVLLRPCDVTALSHNYRDDSVWFPWQCKLCDLQSKVNSKQVSMAQDLQDLSLASRAFMYKTSPEGLNDVFSVAGFVLLILFAVFVLLMLCNFLVHWKGWKSRDQKTRTKAAPPKRNQTVYSSMLPPREHFLVNMDTRPDPVRTQTPGHVVIEKPEPQGKVWRKRPLMIHAGDMRRIYRAKRAKERYFQRPLSTTTETGCPSPNKPIN
ncbi:uncharacterized [Tachysurus ichikawai]